MLDRDQAKVSSQGNDSEFVNLQTDVFAQCNDEGVQCRIDLSEGIEKDDNVLHQRWPIPSLVAPMSCLTV